MSIISRAAADGYGCLSSWADLLDRINVFPVPDSDTGTNLRISLAPLQQPDITPTDLPGLLARSATGNSGNIAAAFLQDFLQAKNSNQLTTAAISGRDKSRQAVLDPKRGTMLDIFDTLAMTLTKQPPPDATGFLPLCKQLQNAVLATSDLLPELKTAGVVDSGALGMFIFLEGFFKTITAFQGATPSVSHRFKDKLTIVPTWSPIPSTSHCIDALLDTAGDQSGGTVRELTALGDSVVVSNDNSKLKIHLHTSNPRRVQDYLTSMGALIHWHDEDMAVQTQQPILIDRPVHIMTDAAGSLDRETAKRQNITLLDSYIIAGDQSCPESLCPPRQIYERMSRGERISTAQASTFERHQHYVSAIQQYKKVLYLCVGSVYTGNYATAQAWKIGHDHRNQLHLLDSGAASGRLALITLLTARFADKSGNADEVISYARQRCHDCREYVFIDELKYLAAGGRVSRTKGFFGDLLHMKPVISPMADGVKKIGMTRSRSDQLEFALNRLQTQQASPCPLVLLQYSDNRQWLQETSYGAIRRLLPKAEIVVIPLSLTSGVHMGPGTWAVAFQARKISK